MGQFLASEENPYSVQGCLVFKDLEKYFWTNFVVKVVLVHLVPACFLGYRTTPKDPKIFILCVEHHTDTIRFHLIPLSLRNATGASG